MFRPLRMNEDLSLLLRILMIASGRSFSSLTTHMPLTSSGIGVYDGRTTGVPSEMLSTQTIPKPSLSDMCSSSEDSLIALYRSALSS